MKMAHGIRVLVLDGTRMVLLVNDGNSEAPNLRVIEHRHFTNPPNREIRDEAPGLNFSTGHPGRNTMERVDPHRENETRFIAFTAEWLDQLTSDDPAYLVVAAPPRVLAEWRRTCPTRLRKRVVGEVAKDLTKQPVAEIVRHLATVLEG